MYLDEYEKITINEFNGLYKRGLADECPKDHAICCENVVFNKRGELSSRPGISPSTYLAHDCRRQFLAINKGTSGALLTLDSSGNLYADDGGSPIFADSGVVDFAAVNLFTHTYILPIVAAGGTPPNLQVWDGSGTTRDAAGLAPDTTFSVADGSSGKVAPGNYLIAVSYITDTGFTTQPGPKITATFTAVAYTAPGGDQIDLTGIPTGPTGTIARQLLITKANQSEFFFIGESLGGFIDDNTTTTATLDFFDTDLAISADYLFDLRETIPGSNVTGDLARYHNRLVLVQFSNEVLVSRQSDQESFSTVDGIVSAPGESGTIDNLSGIVTGTCQLRDVLYLTQFPGVVSVQDNGGEPSTWDVVRIDGGVGSAGPGIGRVGADKSAESTNEFFLLSDLGGIYLFNGAVERMPLTWKIDDLWKQVNFNSFQNITIYMDPFHQTFYVLVPQTPSDLPNLLLVADYSAGLDWKNIKWTIFTFPFTVSSIALMKYAGNMDGSDVYFYLRLSFYGNNYIYKTHIGYYDDIGAAINAYYQSYLASPSTEGNVNVFRFLRFRGKGFGNINILLDAEDFDPALEVNPPPLQIFDPMSKDMLREINFQKEKMSIGFGTGAFVSSPVVGEYFSISRLDIFVKNSFQGRPQ